MSFMKRIRLFTVGLGMLLGLSGVMLPAIGSAAAAPAPTAKSTVCSTLESGSDCSSTPQGQVSLNDVIKVAINVLSIIIGVAAVIMVMVGGFRYITAGGDSNNVTSAKNTIMYAIIGLVIVALAQALVQFVLNKVK